LHGSEEDNVKFKYVGPFDEVEVAGQKVKRNHQFDVSDEVAGQAPDPRRAEAMAELADAVSGLPDHVRAAELRDELGRLEIGDGLLAQPENFQPVTAKAKEADK